MKGYNEFAKLPGPWCTPEFDAVQCANGVVAIAERQLGPGDARLAQTVVFRPGHPDVPRFREAR
jgi:hypothetical protein